LPAELALARLPTGRHGLPRSFVAGNQRLRIIAAMLQLLPRSGYAEITIKDLTREASVSRQTFYAQFAGKEECFLAAYDLTARWLCEQAERAVDSAASWPERVRDGLAEILRLLAENPALACLLTVEAPRAGPAARERQRAGLTKLAAVLRAGRPDRPALPDELEELLLAGALALVARYVEAGRAEQLPEAAEQLLEYLLIPYLGRGETRRFTTAAA
jgi:AcrR family transcriptional regulator